MNDERSIRYVTRRARNSDARGARDVRYAKMGVEHEWLVISHRLPGIDALAVARRVGRVRVVRVRTAVVAVLTAHVVAVRRAVDDGTHNRTVRAVARLVRVVLVRAVAAGGGACVVAARAVAQVVVGTRAVHDTGARVRAVRVRIRCVCARCICGIAVARVTAAHVVAVGGTVNDGTHNGAVGTVARLVGVSRVRTVAAGDVWVRAACAVVQAVVVTRAVEHTARGLRNDCHRFDIRTALAAVNMCHSGRSGRGDCCCSEPGR